MTEQSTEQKIISAAQNIFTKKGFAATRTRDIAEESGINLALINYYFGSKENLFKIIVEQKFMDLFGLLNPILSDENIQLDEKTKLITENYTALLLENEGLAIFVLNHLSQDKELLKSAILQSRLLAQPVLQEQLAIAGYTTSTLDYIMNIISLTLFPFISKDLFLASEMISDENYHDYIIERTKKIPQWIMQILELSKK